jgi:putative transposase
MARVPHIARAELVSRFPVHITLRLRDDVPSLRSRKSMRVLLQALYVGCERLGVRITQYSIQFNHIHLICEAEDAQALTRGIMGLEIRMAHALNRAHGRKGPVWADRYHARILRTPKQVRNCLVYVLGNWRHHGGDRYPRMSLDPCSSALWFDGFREKGKLYPLARGTDTPIATPTTWLLRVGWRKHGLISVAEGAWD